MMDSFLKYLPTSVAKFDREMRFVAASDRWLADNKLDGAGLAGRSYYEIFPQTPEYRRATHQRCLAGAVERSEEEHLQRTDGTSDWMRWEVRPWHEASGAVGGLVIFSEIITDRIKAREALRINEERLQNSLMHCAHEAIAVRDIEGRIQYWNKSAEQIYGWSAAEIVGQKSCEVLYTDMPGYMKAHQILMECGEWTGELCHLTKSGREVVVESHWVLILSQDGQPQSVLVINSDITENKRLEAGFFRLQRMEGIGALTGGIVHDLNNVLTPILMSCDILDSNVSAETANKMLRAIRVSAEHGHHLVKQILSFYRGVEGKVAEVKPEDLLSDLVRMARETFPKNIAVTADWGSAMWTVTGNTTQLEQVLLNLCLNARDAMPHGGKLKLRATNLRLGKHSLPANPDAMPGNYVVFSVTDTGVGIPDAIRDRIFDQFFTTKEIGKGTGLGLSTVVSIAQRHRGFVDVRSTPGKGTSFLVYLPADNSTGKDSPADEIDTVWQPENVLPLDCGSEPGTQPLTAAS